VIDEIPQARAMVLLEGAADFRHFGRGVGRMGKSGQHGLGLLSENAALSSAQLNARIKRQTRPHRVFSPTAEEVEALITRMDTDKSGTIDKEEWRMAWVGGLASQIQKMRSHEVTQAQKATGRTSMRQFTGREEDGDPKNNVPAEGSQEL
jgi:hypothetical protein